MESRHHEEVAAGGGVPIAPPPVVRESVPDARPGHAWISGYWDWRNGHHVWVSGYWARARNGCHWRRHRWILREGRWYLEGGGWIVDERGEARLACGEAQ
ncbi:MAG TPA: YXWGXW repeat-containing protein [Usitatibacter sp.]|nr:YXWGXW repeat-containing protein [Usitatibacter sp.]